MGKGLEDLNLELIQAQILLRASHDFFRNIMLEVTRRKVSCDLVSTDDISQKISAQVNQFSQRDAEIRRMLSRLEKLSKPINKVA